MKNDLFNVPSKELLAAARPAGGTGTVERSPVLSSQFSVLSSSVIALSSQFSVLSSLIVLDSS